METEPYHFDRFFIKMLLFADHGGKKKFRALTQYENFSLRTRIILIVEMMAYIKLKRN